MAQKLRTKIIGIGGFGDNCIGYINSNMFNRLVDIPFLEGDGLKYAISGEGVSTNGIKALLKDTEIAIVISDNSHAKNTAFKIAKVAKELDIFFVTVLYGEAEDDLIDCENTVVVPQNIQDTKEIVFEAVATVVEPIYAQGTVATDVFEIQEVISKSKIGYYAYGGGNTPEEAFENMLKTLPVKVKTNTANKTLARIIINYSVSTDQSKNIAPIMDGLCEITNKDCKNVLCSYNADFAGDKVYLLSVIFIEG